MSDIKELIIFISKGIVTPELRESSILHIGFFFKRYLPENVEIQHVFTSEEVIAEISSLEDQKFLTLSEALSNAEGVYTDVTVIPTSLFSDEILSVNSKAYSFNLRILPYLISTNEMCFKLVNFLAASVRRIDYENTAKIFIIYSRKQALIDFGEKLNMVFNLKGFKEMFVITQEDEELPKQLISILKNMEINNVYLKPSMFAIGDYIDNVFFNKNSIKAKFQKEGFTVIEDTDSLGEIENFLGFYYDHYLNWRYISVCP